MALQVLGLNIEEEDKVAQSFIDLMDGRCEWPPYDLAEDAVMDWFGRTLRGRSAILSFVRTHFPRSQHKVRKALRIPPVEHRLIKRRKAKSVKKRESAEEERGVEDGQHTPDNPIRVDCEQLLRAPRGNRPGLGFCHQDCEYLELRGTLEYCDGTASKQLHRIVLGYSAENIHFVAYEGPSLCRRKLLPLFSQDP